MTYRKTWPVAALLIAAVCIVQFVSEQYSTGNWIPEPSFCQAYGTEVWSVHRMENCRLTYDSEEGCGDTEEHVVGIGCHDKGEVATCNPDESCGKIYKIMEVDCEDQQLVAALYYQEQVYRQKNFVISPEEYLAAADFLTIDEFWVRNRPQSIAIKFETWRGCKGYDIGAVSDKYAVCLGGKAYRMRGDFDAPYDHDIACSCNGETTEFMGYSVCSDFACEGDVDPDMGGAHVCPDMEATDGDDESVEQEMPQ